MVAIKKASGSISATALREKIRAVTAEIEKHEQAIYATMECVDQLKVRKAAFVELLGELKPNEAAADEPLRLTDVVMGYVRMTPGVRAAVVVDNVLSKVPTHAKDPRKNVHQTILNLKNRGWLQADESGALTVSPNAGMNGNTNGHGGKSP